MGELMSNAKIIEHLKLVLADTYALFLKTQNYHWNVTGPNFKTLHVMFEEHYNDLFIAIDVIAERIRALGSTAPGSFSSYSKLTKIQDGKETADAKTMLKELASDQEILVKTLTVALKDAQKLSDEVTAGMLIARIEIHEKNAWMLKSSI